jgi:hypothetical protein
VSSERLPEIVVTLSNIQKKAGRRSRNRSPANRSFANEDYMFWQRMAQQ